MAERRAYDPEATRKLLLDVAADAFQRRGYHGVGVHEIIKAAGVTSGALYHHFESKKALGLAVVREQVAGVIEDAWIKPVKEARSATAGVKDAFASIIESAAADGVIRGCPLNNLAIELSFSDADFRSAVREVFDGWRRALAAEFADDVAQGRLRKGVDAEEAASFVVAVFEGAMSLAKCDQDKRELRACARQLNSYLDTLK